MANRTFQDVQAVSREVKILNAVLTSIDGSGSASFSPSLGIESVGKAGGVLTVLLKDKYNDLLAAHATIGGGGGGTTVKVTSDTVGDAGDNKVVFTVAGSLGANDTLHITLFLKNTSVPN